jgi:hypothetical protein
MVVGGFWRQPHIPVTTLPGKLVAIHHPGVILPGKDAVLGSGGKVVSTSKNGRTSKSLPALEWLANLCSQIPNRGEQMVRY